MVFKKRRPFKVSYTGELGVDAGGLFTDLLASVGLEVSDPSLGLFYLNDEGWLFPHPVVAENTSAALTFLGKLFGLAIGCREVICVDLHPFCWKYLTFQVSEDRDYRVLDKCLFDLIDRLQDSMSKEDVEGIAMNFVIPISGVEIELKPGGSTVPLTYENRTEFIDLARAKRKACATDQLDCLQRGLASVIGWDALAQLHWRDLETLICGSAVVSAEAMKRHSISPSGSSCKPWLEFWDVVGGFTQKDLAALLKFATGRNRIPSQFTSGASPRGLSKPLMQIRFVSELLIDSLPVAHTCSATLDVPSYSSPATLKKQLLLAIHNCDTTDLV